MTEITKEDLLKTEENLARIISKGFEENTKQHKEIFKVLDIHTERLDRIETKLENIVYRNEFEELVSRVKTMEEALAINK